MAWFSIMWVLLCLGVEASCSEPPRGETRRLPDGRCRIQGAKRMARATEGQGEDGREVDQPGFQTRETHGYDYEGVISKPFVWQSLNDVPARVISDLIEVEAADKPGAPKKRMFVRWALVKLDDHRVVSLNFTIPADAPGDRSTYIRLTEQIADSVRPRAAAVEPKPKEINPVGADR